ncbi:DNA cytosine methyltransferase [Cryomorpha ignava]|uniref:Cytosine-specific methyltransferase n=1 Tax=Cryomorpha ignava TaxID=101383 RepID=A0A7K3WL89_9FLAO|nr:DNA cytosine methyltransferase [Cryomorpha ignava]NEN22254.1 DNA cytosine methyltransferase [Cryomorpha ignava]
MTQRKYKVLEICAGAGGQALGLEDAGFDHSCLVEIEKLACETLKFNRPDWNVVELDVKLFSAEDLKNIDLLAGGVPCPPFSIAGKQEGEDDERDLFPQMIRLAKECDPKAILIENVKGLLSKKFDNYRYNIDNQFYKLGYRGRWQLLYSSDFGVSQLRPRAVYVAFKQEYIDYFQWPQKLNKLPVSVGELLHEEMSANKWKLSNNWKNTANSIAPTLVGGSKKHGGPDLGPSRARKAWAKLGVNGSSLADSAPQEDFDGPPRLTVQMAALVQGFPASWRFIGRKTAAYRQVGNAFPPPVAKHIGIQIISALNKENKNEWSHKREKVLELNFESIS